MRSFLVCALLLAFVAASAQAGAVKTRRSETRAVQYSCDVKGIAALVKDIIADSIAVVFDVKGDLSNIGTRALSCLDNDLTNPEKLVKCVVSEAKSEVSDIIDSVREYISDLKSSAEQIRSKLQKCAKF